ncbi:rCG59213 [Rattus norvegicus]|uniref:RCG59213 n=1 Tax=Rattus norvegicus TaxID=10116 RepID=A6K7G3_RAT|nr:rCG59213 [Rattus norvegicus]
MAGMRHWILCLCRVCHHVRSALPLCDVTVILCVVTSSPMTSHHLTIVMSDLLSYVFCVDTLCVPREGFGSGHCAWHFPIMTSLYSHPEV